MKKKLLIFLPSLAGGGAERTVVNIINYIDKKIFDVTLVLISKNINNEHKHEYLENLNSNVKVLYLNCKLSRLHIFNIIYKLCQTINKENPDIIFSTTFNANVISIISNKLAKKNIPVVIRETTNRTKLGVNLFGKLVTRFIYNQSDTVVSLSKGVKNDLINNFKVKKEKIKLIYNPVDIKHINNSKNAKVEDFLLPKENMKNIIAVGRLIEAKDFSVLLKAFKLISNNIKSRLLILGKGPEENKLKLLCKELQIEDKVYFLGFKKNPYKYMNISDLFILSSKREGFAHVIVEAMAVGIPVISTDCESGPREIIGENTYGKLVGVGDFNKLAEESLKILNQPEESKRLIELGSIRAKDFVAEKIVKEYQDLFINIIDSKNNTL